MVAFGIMYYLNNYSVINDCLCNNMMLNPDVSRFLKQVNYSLLKIFY